MESPARYHRYALLSPEYCGDSVQWWLSFLPFMSASCSKDGNKGKEPLAWCHLNRCLPAKFLLCSCSVKKWNILDLALKYWGCPESFTAPGGFHPLPIPPFPPCAGSCHRRLAQETEQEVSAISCSLLCLSDLERREHCYHFLSGWLSSSWVSRMARLVWGCCGWAEVHCLLSCILLTALHTVYCSVYCLVYWEANYCCC